MIQEVFWLDDDKKKLRVIPDLLRELDVRFLFAHSLLDARRRLAGAKKISLLLLDAIVPAHRLEDFDENENHYRETDLEKREHQREGQSFLELEKGGRRFLDWCSENKIELGRVVMISYVSEARLAELGYSYDAYINKLMLPDRLDFLAAEALSITGQRASREAR